tara:strand:+ start:6546 stop:6989 length:444 start_codon:yes stop_codon:yes gene_type:complete
MTSMFRNVLVLLIAALLAVPTVCDPGGENGGGGGVWILPFCANVGGVNMESTAPRGTWIAPNTASDVSMRTASQMGAASATFVDDVLGVPVSLSVTGRIVTVSHGLLQALAGSSKQSGIIIVTDAVQSGYVLRVAVQPDGSVKFDVL